jgi:hypothetical protein
METFEAHGLLWLTTTSNSSNLPYEHYAIVYGYDNWRSYNIQSIKISLAWLSANVWKKKLRHGPLGTNAPEYYFSLGTKVRHKASQFRFYSDFQKLSLYELRELERYFRRQVHYWFSVFNTLRVPWYERLSDNLPIKNQLDTDPISKRIVFQKELCHNLICERMFTLKETRYSEPVYSGNDIKPFNLSTLCIIVSYKNDVYPLPLNKAQITNEN